MKEAGEEEPFVIATGGLAKLIAEESNYVDKIDPYLTIEGLKIIYEKKQGVDI